jgi:hypothetical protein
VLCRVHSINEDLQRVANEQFKKVGGSGGSCPTTHSFVAATLVLMADGSIKPISEVDIGDKVKATDPTTGETTDRDVVATIVHDDEGDMTRLTVASEGGSTGTVDATSWHPVWVDAEGRFVNIGDLKPGQHLTSTDGTSPKVTAVDRYTHFEPVYDLTIDGVHTYYVVTGGLDLLVHNCGSALLDRARELYGTRADEASTVAVARVRNRNSPDEFETWVATERTGLPEEWKGGRAPLSDERYMPGRGHVETTIMNSLGADWEIIGMASSTRMCPACFAKAVGAGLRLSSIGKGSVCREAVIHPGELS